MISKRFLQLFVLVLTLLGVFIAIMRHEQTQIPFLSNNKKDVWMVEARVDFKAQKNRPITVSLSLPEDTLGYKLYFEQSVSAGYGFSMVQKDGIKRGEWSIRQAQGKQTLYYKAQIVQDFSNDLPLKKVESELHIKDEILWSASEQIAANEIIDLAYAKSSNNITFTRELIKILTDMQTRKDGSLLLLKREYINVLSKLLSDAGVLHRISLALELEDARRNQSLTSVIEVLDKDEWVLFDPNNALQEEDKNFFLWTRGGKSLIEIQGGSNATVNFSMVKQSMPALELAQAHFDESGFGIFSIHRLPIEEQSLFKILLLLPIGALITVFMRLIIGIKTSGTFMPVLIAMAFLQTSLFLGLLNFVVLVAIGLILRSYLSNLNLLLVSRIATIIVIVIFLVAFMTLVGYELGFNTGMSVAFFPIIILAWTIERMSILWEEEGAKEVLTQGSGSLLVAVLAYMAMVNGYVAHLCFNFPELHLIVIALMILMGRYTGYRLLELRRFREFKNS
ncbi:MAG: inactive transglutaminase family protein [Sulfurimonas sp.]|uniref:inactive transglutaminase family protein n=1 Tax=Sulfurimonas sp. TaxID=2022749 RepID=UPI0025D39CBB|nr:inactive transglutaminase family protein [Sulfurimonas sp.]MCK9492127.1 inactive transglutaminase family protein [Sulfurimonas sp.]